MNSINDVIRQRFSCRTYLERPISSEKRQELGTFIDHLENGPFGSRPRFHLVAAEKEDSHILKDLGTYGFIQGAAGFIIGTLDSGEKTSKIMATRWKKSSCSPPV
jgi:hypothetical protein